MIFMIVYIFCLVVALALGVMAGWSDIKSMTIPNSIVAGILALFFVAFAAVHLSGTEGVFFSFGNHMTAGLIMLLVTFIVYSLKIFGGGDSKLIAAFSFWVGLKGLIPFLFYMGVAGTALGGLALFLKKKKPVKNPKEKSWVARVQSGENVVPYGVPIAFGALAGCIYIGLLSPETLSLFLISN